MKKLLSLILSVLILVSPAFAVTDFFEPSDEVVTKIKTAIINDRNKVFHSLYFADYPTVERDIKL